MIRIAFVTLFLTLPLHSFAADSADSPPNLSNSFFGTWTGELRVVHAPMHPDAPATLAYKLEINDQSTSVFLLGQGWQAVPAPHVVSATPTHAVLAVSDIQEYWVEDFVFHLIVLSEDRMAIYVSRVVDNFQQDADGEQRHFPVYVAGELTKEPISQASGTSE